MANDSEFVRHEACPNCTSSDAFARYSPYILIQSTEKKNEGFVYSELVPTKYKIDENYYLSNPRHSHQIMYLRH